MLSTIKNHLELHLIVLIYGFTAILGRLITLDAEMLVAWRMTITVLVLGFIIIRKKEAALPPVRHSIIYMLVGVIVASHWITFFGAIKVANISVALGGLASTTLFVSIFEPIVLKRRFSVVELIIGIAIIIGLYIIFKFETQYITGLIIAVTSAFLAAIFTVLNKWLIQTRNGQPLAIGFFEMAGGLVAVVIYILSTGSYQNAAILPSPADWFWLALLAIVCTAYPYVATIRLMKSISAYTVVLAVNMEPVYGIILAALIFGSSEMMTGGFYAGAAIIITSVFVYPIILKKSTAFKRGS
jgi:drug/metabolite transporter (DMT)-like permease